MPRTLSSRLTFPVKVLFPAIWSIGWGIGTLQLVLHPEDVVFNGVKGGAPRSAGLVFFTVWLLGTAFVVAFGWGVKRVRLDGDQLLVSNYVREIRVPLSSVVDVYCRTSSRGGSVILKLDSPTAFGSTVTFVARGRAVRFGGEMRVAAELRDLAEAARHDVR